MPVIISQQAQAITSGFLNTFLFPSSELTKQSMTYCELQLSYNAGRRKTLHAGEIQPNNCNPERKERAGSLARYLRATPSFRLCCVYTNMDGRHKQKLTMPSGSAKFLENQHKNINVLPVTIQRLSQFLPLREADGLC